MNTFIAATMIALSPLQVCQGGGLEHNDIFVTEDSPYFDCRRDGNQICGPDNPWGHPAGYYGEGDCTNPIGLAANQGVALPFLPEWLGEIQRSGN